MAHWLFKSEPATWSWTQMVAAGAKGTFWNGVRNHLAKKQMMAMQKGDTKQGEAYIRAAIRAGIPDKESEAVAFLSMCQIFMNKREFRAAKDYFRKAKACKPTTKQVVDQIKEIEKYISRMPG